MFICLENSKSVFYHCWNMLCRRVPWGDFNSSFNATLPLPLLGLLVIVDESLFPHILVHVVESFQSLVFSLAFFFPVVDLEFYILFYLSPTLD